MTLAGRRIRKETLHGLWSPHLKNRRDVDVYLPASYGGARRYPVVYMHDGQNLSDPNAAFAGTWHLEDALDELVEEHGIEPIVVGVHNTARRLAEYSPFPDRRHRGGDGDAYLQFLRRTLKPRIDRMFRTRRGAGQTAIVGSSMGGLISLYGSLRYPETFGLAAAMSPSLWYGRDRLFEFVESARTPRGRVYLDIGMGEGAGALRDARAMSTLLRTRGLEYGRTLMYLEDRRGRHDETSWGRRVAGALQFLLQ